MRESVGDVIRLLKYILFNPYCTIVEMAGALEFTEQYVTDMIKTITDNPVNRIMLHTAGKNDKVNFNRIKSLRKLKWKISDDNLDSIPLGYIMNRQERSLLTSLMVCMGVQYDPKDIMGKNTSVELPESMLFCFSTPEKVPGSGKIVNALKKAIQARKMISLRMKNSTEKLVLKPHCFIRDDITAEWSLACEDTDRQFTVIPVKRIGEVLVQNRDFFRTVPVNRDWSISQNMKNNSVQAEILIESFPWVEEKFYAQFKNFGEFTRLENGNILFSGTLYHKESLKVFLMRFGAAVQVLSPDWLRNEILQEARQVVFSMQKVSL